MKKNNNKGKSCTSLCCVCISFMIWVLQMEKWIQIAKRADFYGIAKKYNISPVLARLMVNRDICGDEHIRKYLYGTLDDLYAPLTMKDIFKGASIIEEYVKKQMPIAIASDFDVDGIFSSFILYKGFKRIGGNAMIYTPNRVTEGYGLHTRIVHEAYVYGRWLFGNGSGGYLDLWKSLF